MAVNRERARRRSGVGAPTTKGRRAPATVVALALIGLSLMTIVRPGISSAATLAGSTFEIDGDKAGVNDWEGWNSTGDVTVSNDLNSTGGMTPDS